MMSLHSALRAQLGVAVPAMSIAKEGSLDPEPCLLFFGIVDFLQVHALGPPDAHVGVFCWMCCAEYTTVACCITAASPMSSAIVPAWSERVEALDP